MRKFLAMVCLGLLTASSSGCSDPETLEPAPTAKPSVDRSRQYEQDVAIYERAVGKTHGLTPDEIHQVMNSLRADPAFKNTASCRSAVTFIDGAEGVLTYRGYPIEELAEHSTFLEVAYLLLYRELPSKEEHAASATAQRFIGHQQSRLRCGAESTRFSMAPYRPSERNEAHDCDAAGGPPVVAGQHPAHDDRDRQQEAGPRPDQFTTPVRDPFGIDITPLPAEPMLRRALHARCVDRQFRIRHSLRLLRA